VIRDYSNTATFVRGGALKCGGVAYTLLSASFVCVRVSIVSAVFPFVF
jgi:hypothetical protein